MELRKRNQFMNEITPESQEASNHDVEDRIFPDKDQISHDFLNVKDSTPDSQSVPIIPQIVNEEDSNKMPAA